MSQYKHLSINEREKILVNLFFGKSVREIARLVGRSPSTISRELTRNTTEETEYSPCTAQNEYALRRQKSGKKCILDSLEVKAKVQDLFLNKQWSPEQISERLKMENNTISLSFNTGIDSVNTFL